MTRGFCCDWAVAGAACNREARAIRAAASMGMRRFMVLLRIRSCWVRRAAARFQLLFGGGWRGHDGVVLGRQFRRRYRIAQVGGLGDFDGEDITAAKHVAGEEDVFLVWRKARVRFGAVVLVRHVDRSVERPVG